MKKTIYLTILAIVTVVCIIFGSCYHVFRWGFSIMENFMPFWAEGSESGTVSDSGEIELDEFSSIDVDVSVMDLNIETSDHYSISYSATQRLVPEYEVKAGKLLVKQKRIKRWGRNNKCRVTITVPKGLTQVKLDASVGDIDLVGVSVSDLKIDASTGDIKIDGCTLKDASVDASIGDIGFINTVFDTLEIDASTGEVKVGAPFDLSGYDMELDTSIGEITVNGSSYRREYSQKGTEPGKSILIDTSVGDIKLTSN